MSPNGLPPMIVGALLPDSLDGVNFARGRGACPYPIDTLVVHCTEGDAASVRAWFRNPASEVSAHYMVTKLGVIVQFVDEADKAFHAGQLVQPSSALVAERYGNGRWTPNSYGIGVECESSGTEELTNRQRAALYQLLADILARRAIPIDRTHILGHHEIKASKTCPGGISVDRIVSDLAASVPKTAPDVPKSAPLVPKNPASIPPIGHPRVVWSNVLNDYIAVVRYVSDREWYYARLAEISVMFSGARASTPLSQMPLHPAEAE